MSPGAYDFAYDAIGNRMTSNVNEQDPTMTYTRNDVNQYTATTGPGTTPAESFTYEKDGTLQTDGKYRYVWDGENRLIRIEPVGTPVNNDKKLEYEYDYMGRRVEKVYSKHNGSDWVVQTTYRFVYDNWNVVLVLLGDGSTRYKFTWGLDLSGLAGDASVSGIHGSGGIGGLLANQTMSTPSTDWWYLYDGNGNVTQVIRPTDLPYFALTSWAHFEYDPYGNVAAFSGFMGVSIRRLFCFSTKWVDTELAGAEVYGAVGTDGLYYYGYRYYSPRLGRWISRDPIEELGGLNLYGFVGNGPMFGVDPLGEWPVLPGPRPNIPPGYPRDPQVHPGIPIPIGTITLDVQDCQTCAGISISFGVELYRTGELRLQYTEELLQLKLKEKGLSQSAGSAARSALQEKWRELQTQFGKAYTDVYRHVKPVKPTGSFWKPSDLANRHARIFKVVGKGLIVIGVTIDVATIVQAPSGERAKVIVRTVASNAGAYGGTLVGAGAGRVGGALLGRAIGGVCGSLGGPVGTVAGALAGGVVGAWAGDVIGGVIYDWSNEE